MMGYIIPSILIEIFLYNNMCTYIIGIRFNFSKFSSKGEKLREPNFFGKEGFSKGF